MDMEESFDRIADQIENAWMRVVRCEHVEPNLYRLVGVMVGKEFQQDSESS